MFKTFWIVFATVMIGLNFYLRDECYAKGNVVKWNYTGAYCTPKDEK